MAQHDDKFTLKHGSGEHCVQTAVLTFHSEVVFVRSIHRLNHIVMDPRWQE